MTRTDTTSIPGTTITIFRNPYRSRGWMVRFAGPTYTSDHQVATLADARNLIGGAARLDRHERAARADREAAAAARA